MTERTETPTSGWVTPAIAAKALGISTTHLARLADKGVIKAIQPGGEGGHRRYSEASIEARLAGAPWDAA